MQYSFALQVHYSAADMNWQDLILFGNRQVIKVVVNLFVVLPIKEARMLLLRGQDGFDCIVLLFVAPVL